MEELQKGRDFLVLEPVEVEGLRRKKAPIYKDVLKQYATVSLELGYHNLFFPGGTRSRRRRRDTGRFLSDRSPRSHEPGVRRLHGR